VLRRALYLRQMLHNESLSAAVLAARQLQMLRAVVHTAAERVPFYRDLYAAHGLTVGSFRSLEDLPFLPIIDKQMLRAAGTAALSLDAPARRVTIGTSGSTGEPFKFQIDHRYDHWRKAQYLRPYVSNGQRITDKVLRVTANPKRRARWLSKVGLLREWQLDCASDPARIVEAWTRLAPDVLQGYPSSLRSLAHHCLDAGEALWPAPRLVFTDSELLTADTRALLERAFATSVLDVFGTFETDNIAFQCAVNQGYHVTTDSVVLEIVRDGMPVPIGEEGEIVVTVLANQTLPFIRYNLRDIGRLSPHSCSCGRPFPLLAVIQGRANDQIVLADGRRRTPPGILAHLTGFIDAILHYQLRQLEIGRFELLIVPTGPLPEVNRIGIVKAMETALGHAKVELRLVERILPDPSGKRRAFVSDLAQS
jgi:phenylacetate-CoA ligase